MATSRANAPSDVTGIFGIGLDRSTCGRFESAQKLPAQYDWQKLIFFTPAAWTVARGADIPDGTQVGTYKSEITLGLLNNGCNLVLNVNYDLFEGTIEQSNPLDAKPAGSPDRLSTMAADVNGNHVPDAADRWPSYLNAVAKREGMDFTNLIARYVGINHRDVVGTTMVVNFLVFNPGARLSSKFAVDPDLGYPTVVVLQDPTSAGSNRDPVSDDCAPLWTELTLNGTAAGKTFRGNPGAGTYYFVTWALPQPDADGDGIENVLDPCPLTPNASGWDPAPRGSLPRPVILTGTASPTIAIRIRRCPVRTMPPTASPTRTKTAMDGRTAGITVRLFQTLTSSIRMAMGSATPAIPIPASSMAPVLRSVWSGQLRLARADQPHVIP